MLGRKDKIQDDVEPAAGSRWRVEDAVLIGVSGKRTLQSAMDEGSKKGWDLRFIIQGASDFVLIVWDTTPMVPAGAELREFNLERP